MKISLFGKKVKKHVKIKREAYEKMLGLSEEMEDSEVGGLIICSEENHNTIVVEDIIVPKQEASAGDVTMDAEQVAQILQPFIKTKPEIWAKCKGWWHSHGNGSPFWSNIDEDNIKSLMSQFTPVISIVTTSTGKMCVRIDDVLSNGLTVSIDNIKPNIESYSPKIINWIKQQRHKIKESTFIYTSDKDDNFGYAHNPNAFYSNPSYPEYAEDEKNTEEPKYADDEDEDDEEEDYEEKERMSQYD